MRGAGLGNSTLAHLVLEGLHLCEAADVALLVGEFGAHVGTHKFFGEFFTGDPRAQDEDINVVVLDALMGGIGVRAHTGADPTDFVGGDAGTDTAAANENATLGATIEDGFADGF